MQPAGEVAVIVDVPVVPPVTVTVVGLAVSTVATVVLLLVHVPPDIVEVKVVVRPEQMLGPPVITGGELTVIVALPVIVVAQPVGPVIVPTTVYVPPAAINPKSTAAPMPESGGPTGVGPLNSW
jgi:hypothetical protein